MENSTDTQWWLERYGRLGHFMRKVTIESLRNAHEEHANAQAQITANHSRVYGPVNFSAQDFFHAALKSRAEVSFERPRPGASRLPVVNGRAVVFWRYANKEGVDVLTKTFGTSGHRIAAFNMERTARQEVLDLDIDEDLQLTAADVAFLEKMEEVIATEEEEAVYPVTVVAYSSNVSGLYNILCADAKLNNDGTLGLSDINSLVTDLREQPLARSSESKRFDQAPKKQFNLKSKTGNEG
ncbi:hypothetical protein M8J71_10980 [Pseudarthrobacter sp. R1]|uniref:hypothetical protein n=1 Tax=Pseudarthrobacter sp. R1 TaxID=2944934 RepID=UPI00210A422E|nr:hypothetical protein [Pseudarthrobacter sp. R1]MCQ6271007.1 hypothetical protein [Pseudarthrobacter sp. R1]